MPFNLCRSRLQCVVLNLFQSQIKKLYFGALRIRKEQEANDPTLVNSRPPVTVHVHDALRGRLNEARTRNRR